MLDLRNIKQIQFYVLEVQENAEKEAQQDRSEARRQGRTTRSPVPQHNLRPRYLHPIRLHCHRCQLPSPPFRPYPRPTTTHRPLQSPKYLKGQILQSLFIYRAINPHKPLFRKMEVEVKLRLPDSSAHQSLSTLLSPSLIQTHFQYNLFFDGANSELSSVRAVLRLRFYGDDPKTANRCVVCLKAKAVIVDGISTVAEDEEELDPSLGRAIRTDPNLIWSTEGRVLKRVREEFGVNEGGGYVCLGGFRNVRGVYEWNGLKLEVDETLFEFGTLYEVECESAEPEKAKEIIEGLLKDNGIPYSYSKVSKFAIFLAGELPSISDA